MTNQGIRYRMAARRAHGALVLTTIALFTMVKASETPTQRESARAELLRLQEFIARLQGADSFGTTLAYETRRAMARALAVRTGDLLTQRGTSLMVLLADTPDHTISISPVLDTTAVTLHRTHLGALASFTEPVGHDSLGIPVYTPAWDAVRAMLKAESRPVEISHLSAVPILEKRDSVRWVFRVTLRYQVGAVISWGRSEYRDRDLLDQVTPGAGDYPDRVKPGGADLSDRVIRRALPPIFFGEQSIEDTVVVESRREVLPLTDLTPVRPSSLSDPDWRTIRRDSVGLAIGWLDERLQEQPKDAIAVGVTVLGRHAWYLGPLILMSWQLLLLLHVRGVPRPATVDGAPHLPWVLEYRGGLAGLASQLTCWVLPTYAARLCGTIAPVSPSSGASVVFLTGCVLALGLAIIWARHTVLGVGRLHTNSLWVAKFLGQELPLLVKEDLQVERRREIWEESLNR